MISPMSEPTGAMISGASEPVQQGQKRQRSRSPEQERKASKHASPAQDEAEDGEVV